MSLDAEDEFSDVKVSYSFKRTYTKLILLAICYFYSKRYILFFFNFQPPPIFEDLNERVKEYLLKPERLSIHRWERSQTHWHRQTDVDSLFNIDDEEIDPSSTLEVNKFTSCFWALFLQWL